MRVDQLGDGTPEVAVVAGIHGDEPCGVRAVERLLAESPEVARPVKLIVANEEAVDAGVRYLEEDLNRAFPGDANGETHESRLAYHLASELEGCTALALHSTQSTGEPFAVCETVDEVTRATVPRLPLSKLVATGRFAEGRLVERHHTIEVECGLQGSEEAAENAYRITRAFLAATGAFPAAVDTAGSAAEGGDVEVFRLVRPVPKPPAERYEVFVENFELVEAGDPFASADGETFTADEQFYPVLMSPYGYADVFGYAADRFGVL